MIKKECYIWVGQIIEYRGMTLRKVRPGKYIVISPCSLVSRPVYIDKNENLNVVRPSHHLRPIREHRPLGVGEERHHYVRHPPVEGGSHLSRSARCAHHG